MNTSVTTGGTKDMSAFRIDESGVVGYLLADGTLNCNSGWLKDIKYSDSVFSMNVFTSGVNRLRS
jgi:hypothetical protein